MSHNEQIAKLLELLHTSAFERGDNTDRALLFLLSERRDELPALNDDFMDSFKEGGVGSVIDFRKSAIRCLLQSSQEFWRCFERVQRM